jgi:hypothetical protein
MVVEEPKLHEGAYEVHNQAIRNNPGVTNENGSTEAANGYS